VLLCNAVLVILKIRFEVVCATVDELCCGLVFDELCCGLVFDELALTIPRQVDDEETIDVVIVPCTVTYLFFCVC